MKLLDLERRATCPTASAAAKALGVSKAEVRRLIDFVWLIPMPNPLDIIAEAEADFRASGLTWRVWRRACLARHRRTRSRSTTRATACALADASV